MIVVVFLITLVQHKIVDLHVVCIVSDSGRVSSEEGKHLVNIVILDESFGLRKCLEIVFDHIFSGVFEVSKNSLSFEVKK